MVSDSFGRRKGGRIGRDVACLAPGEKKKWRGEKKRAASPNENVKKIVGFQTDGDAGNQVVRDILGLADCKSRQTARCSCFFFFCFAVVDRAH